MAVSATSKDTPMIEPWHKTRIIGQTCIVTGLVTGVAAVAIASIAALSLSTATLLALSIVPIALGGGAVLVTATGIAMLYFRNKKMQQVDPANELKTEDNPLAIKNKLENIQRGLTITERLLLGCVKKMIEAPGLIMDHFKPFLENDKQELQTDRSFSSPLS